MSGRRDEILRRAREIRETLDAATESGLPIDPAAEQALNAEMSGLGREVAQIDGGLFAGPEFAAKAPPPLKPGMDTVHDFDTPIDIGPARDPLWQPTPEPGEPPINAWELEGASSVPPVKGGDHAPLHEELQRHSKALRDGPAADRALPQEPSSQLTTKLTDVPMEPLRPRTQEKPGTGTKEPKALESGEPSMPGRLPALLGLGVSLRALGLIGAVTFALLLTAVVAVGSGLTRPSTSPAPAAAGSTPAATLPAVSAAAAAATVPAQASLRPPIKVVRFSGRAERTSSRDCIWVVVFEWVLEGDDIIDGIQYRNTGPGLPESQQHGARTFREGDGVSRRYWPIGTREVTASSGGWSMEIVSLGSAGRQPFEGPRKATVPGVSC